MKKSTFCTDHFALHCKLCGVEEPAPDTAIVAPLVQPVIPFTTPIPTESVGLLVGGSYVNMSAIEIAQPKIQSEEAQAVVSVTEEYAKSCDEHEHAHTAVIRMREHIVKMQEALGELVADEASKKNKKNELKRKVLETLAMGGE